MPWRTGLIGCGAIGSRYDETGSSETIYTHAGMLNAAPCFEFVGIAEIDPDRRAACQKAWRLKAAYADYRNMLQREHLDVISIATPDDTHADILRAVVDIAPPRVVFMEKPLAESAEAGRILGQLCEAAGTVLIVDYIRRYDANHNSVRNYLAAGKLGRVHTVCAQYVRGIRHNGCHIINTLRLLMGEPFRVTAFGMQQGSLSEDPSLDVRLEFANGAVAQITAQDRLEYAFSIFELEITGALGRIRLDATGRNIQLYNIVPFEAFPEFFQLHATSSPWNTETYGKAMLEAAQEINRAAINPQTQLKNGWREATRDLEIIEAAMTSAKSDSQTIQITPFNPLHL